MTVSSQTSLVRRVQCPSCSHAFGPESIRFISEHSALQGDSIAGPLEGLRFRSSRFDLDGNAIDMQGRVCTRVACPNCHIEMPRALLECPTTCISIVGAPGTGKSCLIGAASWSLRKWAGLFGYSWVDVEPRLNALLHGYESGLFQGVAGDVQKPPKTGVSGGDWYHQVRVGSRVEIAPKPMYFRIARTGGAPSVVVMYDNAGEHFQPVAANAQPSHTRHLGRAQALVFVLDPTAQKATERLHRQELILIEAVARIRRLAGLDQSAKLAIPLIVALTKADLWGKLVGLDLSRRPILAGSQGELDRAAIDSAASRAKSHVNNVFPELMQSLSAFADTVHWVPCSAIKTTKQEAMNAERVRPEPEWAEVPFLVAIAEAELRRNDKSA